MTPRLTEITQHLKAYAAGDQLALDDIVAGLYDVLLVAAQQQLRVNNPNQISAVDLVHEVYLKFHQGGLIEAQNRQHFLAISAKAMRFIIIDQIKSKMSLKRSGRFWATSLADHKITAADDQTEVVAVHDLLGQLHDIDPKLAATVECRYFVGFSEHETAEALSVSVRSVRRYWQTARKWLHQELTQKQRNF